MLKSFVYTVMLLLCSSTVFSQKEYNIEQVTVINLGDGRLLFRDAKKDIPLQGEHRIIDGYHSAYVLANFKDGLFDGKYQEFNYNKLKEEGTYKEGRKEGIYREYNSDGVTVKSELSLTAGKVDGVSKTFFLDGKVESEKGYKNGQEHGVEKRYDHDTGECLIDYYYEEGRKHGKQRVHISGTNEYIEVSYFNHGMLEGKFSQHYMNGNPRKLGVYTAGKKSGKWITFQEEGDTTRIETYANDMLNGESITFNNNGTREKVYNYKDDKKDGVCTDFNGETGKPKRQISYKAGKQHGPEKQWVTSNKFNYIETTMYENGRKNGTYEAVYQADKRLEIKEGTPKEKGQFKNGAKTGHWISYDMHGKIEQEWDI